MRKIVSLFTMLMLITAFAFGQTRTITGTVTDENGSPLPGASIQVKGTRTGVAADNNGQFRIVAKTGDVLVASGAGLAITEVTVGEGNTVSLRVERLITAGTEVVVTALGVTRQPKELGYSVSKVKATELTQAKSVNLQNGLTGKVSGLNIQSVNNGVFQDTRITLRGIRSLTGNNQPMLILDGAVIALGYLSSINPNDIVDVTILKSASATAIYGPDGANGALVVTTKRGSKSKPQVNVGHTVQLERVSYMPKFQTQFGSGSSVDAFGFGVYDPIENQCYGDAFDGSLRPIGRPNVFDGSLYEVPYSALPKEKLKFWNTGVTNQTDLSFSTGDFYMSAQNVLIQGIMPKDQNRRVSVHMAANKEYNRFKASYSLNYTKGNFDVTNGSTFGNGRDYTVYWNLINTPMQIPLTRFKDWRNDYWSSPTGYFNDYYSNPYFMIDNFRGVGRTEDIFGNFQLDFKVNNWLSLTYQLAATISNGTQKNRAEAYTYTPLAIASGKTIAQSGSYPSEVQDFSSTSSSITSLAYATADKKFGDFNLNVLAGQSFTERNSKNISLGTDNLAIPSLFNIINRKGEPTIAGESTFKSRLERFFAKVAVSYKNWAFVEGTGSYDINSRLANYYDFDYDAIHFFYPGVSVSAILSEAIPAIKSSKVISYLKIRGAKSKTGNVNLGDQALDNTFGLGGGFPYGSLVGYTSGNTLRLPKYTPEFVKNYEAGFEISLFRNRINFEATWYTQKNSDQIVNVAYSGATGFTSAVLNAASFENRGLELDLRLTPLVKIGEVKIDVKSNFTIQTNYVSKIIEGVDQLGIGNGNYVIVGYPAYTFQLTDYVRDDQGRVIVNSTTGYPTQDPNIKTFGGSGTPSKGTKGFLGLGGIKDQPAHTAPNYLLGLNLNVSWRRLSFSAVGDYRGGASIYTGNLGNGMDFSGVSKRSGQNGRQPFIMPNSSIADPANPGKYIDNTSVYMVSGGYNFWSQAINTAVNSNYLVSGNFWKIREVSLSYSLPTKWFGFTKNAIKAVDITVSGRNLFMFLPKTNEWTDPEFSNTTGNAQGVSGLDNTPPTRIFGASINITL